MRCSHLAEFSNSPLRTSPISLSCFLLKCSFLFFCHSSVKARIYRVEVLRVHAVLSHAEGIGDITLSNRSVFPFAGKGKSGYSLLKRLLIIGFLSRIVDSICFHTVLFWRNPGFSFKGSAKMFGVFISDHIGDLRYRL